jgi:hypothetical protein
MRLAAGAQQAPVGASCIDETESAEGSVRSIDLLSTVAGIYTQVPLVNAPIGAESETADRASRLHDRQSARWFFPRGSVACWAMPPGMLRDLLMKTK